VDWKLSLRSWPYLVIIFTSAVLVYWFQPNLFRFVKS
jgi:hypothetical protein